MNQIRKIFKAYSSASLVLRIVIGLLLGIALGLLVPGWTWLGIPGNLFVEALRAIAPILVFALVTASLSKDGAKLDKRFGTVIFLYLFSTLLAALVAVAASFLFPLTLSLEAGSDPIASPQGVAEVFTIILHLK